VSRLAALLRRRDKSDTKRALLRLAGDAAALEGAVRVAFEFVNADQ